MPARPPDASTACSAASSTSAGLQLAGLNYTGGEFAGLQISAFGNWNGLSTYGVQVSLVNADQTEFRGLAFGGLDYADSVVGAQIGGINLAESVNGLQLGLVNVCDKMKGIQLGLVNMIATSKLPVMVFANVWF